MGLFYTRKGDKGKSYVGKRFVKKTCLEVEALGELDELNSLLGLIKSGRVSKKFQGLIHNIQENLFIIQSRVANAMLGGAFKVPEFKKEKIDEAEDIIDRFEKSLKPAKKFIVSGINPLSAWLDHARAKSRRVERSVLKIINPRRRAMLNPEILAYLNRLSSLLFAMARMAVKESGKKEIHPTYR